MWAKVTLGIRPCVLNCQLTEGENACTLGTQVCKLRHKKVPQPARGAKTTPNLKKKERKKKSRGPGGNLHGHPLPGPTEVQVCRRHWSRIFAFSPPLGGGIQVYHPARNGTFSSAAPLLRVSARTELLLLYGGYPAQYFFLG